MTLSILPATRLEYLKSFVGKKVRLKEDTFSIKAGDCGTVRRVKEVVPNTYTLVVYFSKRNLFVNPEEVEICEEQ